MLAKLTNRFKKTSTELLLFQDLIYVLKHQQNDIIKMYHDDLLREHWGIYKTIKAISWSYFFSHIRKKVSNYVNKCDICHKIKLLRHKSYKEIRITSTSA